jgi:hypothetical protein
VDLLNASSVGRIRVSVSPVTRGELNFSRSALILSESVSRMRAVPSVRQKVRESSASMRLHVGQRFTRYVVRECPTPSNDTP